MQFKHAARFMHRLLTCKQWMQGAIFEHTGEAEMEGRERLTMVPPAFYWIWLGFYRAGWGMDLPGKGSAIPADYLAH